VNGHIAAGAAALQGVLIAATFLARWYVRPNRQRHLTTQPSKDT
jgi:hypothetical protein